MVPLPVLRLLLLCLALLCSAMDTHAGIASYTDRGTIDFDTALHLLNPYGTWSKIDGTWAYTPLDHRAPYTEGRWLYTEYGWYWKGTAPHSWITEHYGYWKRSADKVWSWYPGDTWLAEIVEFRETPTHIGWRSGPVDRNGDFVESPDDRYSKPEEWTFVTKAQFAAPITPDIIAKPGVVQTLLEDSTDCDHAYLTYRPIPRPGPHPADFVALNKDGGMFSPLQTEAVEPPPSNPYAPQPAPIAPATASRIAHMTGTNAPAFAGTGDDADTQIDKRQVKYWITMSLPTYWTPRPTDAKPEELYLYRPDFFQDEDGIARRITLWFNPLTKTSLKEVFAESMGQGKSNSAPSSGPAHAAGTPAIPAQADNPFSSPLDSSFKPGSASHSSSPSTKGGAGTGPAPSGLVTPPPVNATNGAATNAK